MPRILYLLSAFANIRVEILVNGIILIYEFARWMDLHFDGQAIEVSSLMRTGKVIKLGSGEIEIQSEVRLHKECTGNGASSFQYFGCEE